MRVQAINNQNISHKAYFKPNKDLQKLVKNSKIDERTMELADKLLKEMPNHTLEFVKYGTSHNPHLYYPQIINVVTGKTREVCLFANEKENHLNQILSYLVESEKKDFWTETTKTALFNKITKQEH